MQSKTSCISLWMWTMEGTCLLPAVTCKLKCWRNSVLFTESPGISRVSWLTEHMRWADGLSSEWSDCVNLQSVCCWESVIAPRVLCMTRGLSLVTGLLKLVLWHYNNILCQFYKPLQCNMCYFSEANQRYISQGSAAISSIWWRIFFIHL